jgi:inhibitor of KinA
MQLRPLGDCAVVIALGSTIDEATHRRVRAVCARLESHPPVGMIEYVPAFASVTVYYDPARVAPLGIRNASPPHARFAASLEATLDHLEDEEASATRMVEIPVCYGGDLGPDLDDVAQRSGLSSDEVVRLHSGGDYRVYMIGFMAGFAYLGGLPERIATPRRSTPRERVPASSVGIGGSQTGVYPIVSPGGWNIIGRTPLRMFDPDRDPPTLLQMGDHVRFRAISLDAFREMGGTS